MSASPVTHTESIQYSKYISSRSHRMLRSKLLPNGLVRCARREGCATGHTKSVVVRCLARAEHDAVSQAFAQHTGLISIKSFPILSHYLGGVWIIAISIDLRVFASSDSENHRDRNHYTFKVHSLPRPRCIVTIVSSGVDFMVNQRPCVDHPHACSLDAGGGLFHATLENHLGVSALEYTHQSSSSIVPCDVRECIWAVSVLEYIHRGDPAINLVKRSDKEIPLSKGRLLRRRRSIPDIRVETFHLFVGRAR
jgi:hypothetical protein